MLTRHCLDIRLNNWTHIRLPNHSVTLVAHFIILRIILNCNELGSLRIERISLLHRHLIPLIHAVSRSIDSVLKSTVLRARPHIVRLV